MVEPRPVVKWAGGKGRLLDQISLLLSMEFKGYLEPFAGGAAVFFHLCREGRIGSKQILLNDACDELVLAYRAIRDDVETVIAELEKCEPYKTDRDYFYQIRAWDREPGFGDIPPARRAARLIFLNKTCYNGLYRVNSKGQFNVPFGRYKNPRIVDRTNLRAVSQVLKTVDLSNGDFSICLDFARPGDLVYFDPPYAPISDTANFTGYTAGGFVQGGQERLANIVEQLNSRGCHILLSNSDTPAMRALYQGYKIATVTARRAINSQPDKRGPIQELLISNY